MASDGSTATTSSPRATSDVVSLPVPRPGRARREHRAAPPSRPRRRGTRAGLAAYAAAPSSNDPARSSCEAVTHRAGSGSSSASTSSCRSPFVTSARAAVRAGHAADRREPPAGLGDDRHERGHVVQRELGLGRRRRPRPRRRARATRSRRRRACATPSGSGRGSRRACRAPPSRTGSSSDSDASASGVHRGHAQRGDAAASDLPVHAPVPCAAHQRRPSAGADDQPDDHLVALHERDERGPHRHAADEVLRAVDRVDDPAARAVARCRRPPRRCTASRGRARASWSRISSSALLSASETGVRSGLVSTRRSRALKRDIVRPSTWSAITCARRRSSSYPGRRLMAPTLVVAAPRGRGPATGQDRSPSPSAAGQQPSERLDAGSAGGGRLLVRRVDDPLVEHAVGRVVGVRAAARALGRPPPRGRRTRRAGAAGRRARARSERTPGVSMTHAGPWRRAARSATADARRVPAAPGDVVDHAGGAQRRRAPAR